MTILKVETYEDLQRLLIRQKDLSERAKNELAKLTDSVAIIYTPEGTFSETTTNEITRKVSTMLYNYSSLPTLTEFAENPGAEINATWGATFAVTIVMSTVFLRTLMETFPEFTPAIRPIFIRVMNELASASEPGAEADTKSLMEKIMEGMTFQMKDKDGHEILGDAREKIAKQRIGLLLEIIAKLLEDYKLIESTNSGEERESRITPLGKRVCLHINDAEKFIREVGVLYKELADKKSQLVRG